MKKILLPLLIAVGAIAGGFLIAAAVTCTNNFPTSLNNYAAGDCAPSAWGNALEAKLGITGSAVVSSLDYQINHIFTSYGSETVASSAVPWINYPTASSPKTTWLQTSNNLSDLPSTSSARSNLGLGDAALLSSSTFLKVSNNLSDLTSTSSARNTLGLDSIYMKQASNGSDIGNTSTFDSNIGALQVANNLSDLSSTSSARTNIGFNAGAGISISASGTITAAASNVSGATTQIQYNEGNAFSATSSFAFTSSTHAIQIGGNLTVTPTFIQAVSSTDNGTATTSISVVLPSIAKNDTILVACSKESGSVTITGVSDASNTYVLDASTTYSGAVIQTLWRASNAAAGTSTITCTGNSASYWVLFALEYSGLQTTNPVDASSSANGNSSNIADPGAVLTKRVNPTDLVFGASANNNNGNLVSISPYFNQRALSQVAAGNYAIAMDRNTTSTGLFDPTSTWGGTIENASIAIAYKASVASIGFACLWNGSNFTIMSFAANSITPVYSTSTTCTP